MAREHIASALARQAEGQRPASGVGAQVGLVELMPVGGEGERYAVQARIALGLLDAGIRRGVFGLGLDHGDRHRLFLDGKVEDVVRASWPALVAGAGPHEGPWRQLATDPVFAPAALVQRGVDQLGAGIRLVEGHSMCSGHRAMKEPGTC